MLCGMGVHAEGLPPPRIPVGTSRDEHVGAPVRETRRSSRAAARAARGRQTHACNTRMAGAATSPVPRVLGSIAVALHGDGAVI